MTKWLAFIMIPFFLAGNPVKNQKTTKKLESFTITNELVNNNKVWIPEFRSLKAGQEVQFKLVNTLDAPHGFLFAGLTKGVVVAPNKSTTINIKVPKADLLIFKCHMHPAHIGGSIKIEQ